jgi:integrase
MLLATRILHPTPPKGIRKHRGSFEVRFRGPRTATNPRGDYRRSLPTLAEAIAFQKRKVGEWQADKLGISTMPAQDLTRARVGPFLLEPLKSFWKVSGAKSLRQLEVHCSAVEAEFGRDAVLGVTSDRVDKVTEKWRAAGLAVATCNRRREVLGRSYRLAVQQRRLLPSQVPYIPHLTENNARRGFLDRETFDKIIVRIDCPDTADFLRWNYATAMRPGETASLAWSGFDREQGTITLAAADAKTGFGRVIAIAGDLKAIVDRRISARNLGTDLVFHRGGAPITTNSVLKRWTRACEAAKVSGLVPYDLRRTGVRNLVRAGVPERVAMSISGHRTRAVFDRYNISSVEDLRAAMEATATTSASKTLQTGGR